MNPLYSPETLAGAWELVCYLFTGLGVFISCLASLR